MAAGALLGWLLRGRARLAQTLGVALVLGALAVSFAGPAASVGNPGPHGFTQALYAYGSATGNNGSAFAGFTADTPYHNLMLGLAMLLGRFGYILPVLAIAGSLAARRAAPRQRPCRRTRRWTGRTLPGRRRCGSSCRAARWGAWTPPS